MISLSSIARSLALCAAGAFLLSPPATDAAGLLVAEGGLGGQLEAREHAVHVSINNGIAVTQVTEVFHNLERRPVEALYTFPVPNGASVANFSMWINGKEMVGEVLEKERARQIYNSYKQQKRDPGLLEQTDFRTFEMRIFPIGPEADQKVQITYYQELEVDHDWATYVYPLATNSRGGVNSGVNGRFALDFDVQSAIPIAAMECPSHGKDMVIAKQADGYYQASLETKNGSLAKDVVLAYHLERPKTGIDLLTSARPGEEGFFCLTLTAGKEEAKRDQGSDYVFVLDVSGSMREDGKLLLSKDCLGAFIDALGENDRFELMSFNIQPHPAFHEKRAADAKAKEDAHAFLASAEAAGGTVLGPAIESAYRYSDPDRPLNVVILSDGLTEPGETRSLMSLIASRPRNAKVFTVGVGNDVNRRLLQQLSEDSGGLTSFLSPGDNYARQAKAFRRKLMNPVASDLQMTLGGAGVEVFDVESRTMPNLYQGSPVRIYGRYRGTGTAQFSLRGQLNGVEWKQTADVQLPKSDPTSPEIERMWASRRIDALLKEGDRNGDRSTVRPEIVKLGEGYSIATEFTSFLVLENDAELQRWNIERKNAVRLAGDRKVQEAREAELARLREKAVADLAPADHQEAPKPTAAQPISMPNSQPVIAMPAFQPIPPAPAPWHQPLPEPPAPSQSQSHDFSGGRSSSSSGSSGGGGSGPVGPLFVAVSAWLARARRKDKTQA